MSSCPEARSADLVRDRWGSGTANRRSASRHVAAVDRVGRLDPGLAGPFVEGLAHPVVGAGGPDPHDDLVAERDPVGGVERLGESEESADAGPARGAGRVGGQRADCRRSGRWVTVDRLWSSADDEVKIEAGRHLGGGQHADQYDGDHGHQGAGDEQ